MSSLKKKLHNAISGNIRPNENNLNDEDTIIENKKRYLINHIFDNLDKFKNIDLNSISDLSVQELSRITGIPTTPNRELKRPGSVIRRRTYRPAKIGGARRRRYCRNSTKNKRKIQK
jgi:hypothetical protein